jgi:hypothetical protein
VKTAAELLAEFRKVGLAMHQARVEAGATAGAWNKLFDRQQSLYLVLRETEEGRKGLTSLALNDECQTVRDSAAARALFWDAETVRPVLEASAAVPGLAGLSAEMVLREFDAGRLHFDYGTPAR